MGNKIPVVDDVEEFIKKGTESERIALENLKSIAPVIKKQITEQEKRDDLILEMAQQLCEAAGISCQNCPKAHSPEEYGECELPEICNTLADYVIHKEEEAQKGTIKDVMSYLYELSKGDMTDKEAACFDYIERMFCKKFGVEKVTSNSNSEPEVKE